VFSIPVSYRNGAMCLFTMINSPRTLLTQHPIASDSVNTLSVGWSNGRVSIFQNRITEKENTLFFVPSKRTKCLNLNDVSNNYCPASALHIPKGASVNSTTVYINAHIRAYDNYMTYELPVLVAEIAIGQLHLVRVMHALHIFRSHDSATLLLNVMVGEISR
jgi:hypothetical protein